jgi:hypothetical protein
MATLIVEPDGVASVEELADVQSRVIAKKFFWIDLVGEDETTRSAVLRLLAIEDADISWCGRFGESGRMNIRPQLLRVSTWIADGNGKPIENPRHRLRQGPCNGLDGRGGPPRSRAPAIRRPHRRP